MAENSRKTSGVWILFALVLIVAFTLYFLLRSSREKVDIRAAEAAPQTLVSTVATNGRVEALVDFQAHAPAASMINALLVHLGEHVSQGQELVRLDASDAQSKIASAQATLTGAQGSLSNMEAGGTHDELLSERADLANAQTQQREAEQSLATLKALQAKGAASANEVTAAQNKVNDTRARFTQLTTRLHGRYNNTDLATQRAQVTQARAELTAARSAYSGMDVRSPISGVVYSLPYALHDFVPAGDALVNVADLNRLQVRAYFDEPEIGKLQAGQPVSISWDAKPGQFWHGRVTQAPTTIVTYNGTRNVGACLISIDDAHGQLLPNINVTVRVTTSQHANVLSIPREALRTDGALNFVYKVVDGRLVRTTVSVNEGDVNLTRVGVRGGLSRGDVVALAATTDVDLADGMRVRVQP